MADFKQFENLFAFSSTGLRGRIILGVYGFPTKLVHGFTLNDGERKEVESRVHYALHHRFSPSVPTELIKVHFEAGMFEEG